MTSGGIDWQREKWRDGFGSKFIRQGEKNAVKYSNKWVQSITAGDVMESGQVVENPMIGAIPSRNEVQRELDDLLMSM